MRTDNEHDFFHTSKSSKEADIGYGYQLTVIKTVDGENSLRFSVLSSRLTVDDYETLNKYVI